jgi:hypothetical protein
MRFNGTTDEENPPAARERWTCDQCGYSMEVLIGDTFQLQGVDGLALRHAEVLRELALTRERRADALRIAEERRAEVQRLRGLIQSALDPIHILRGRGIGYADDVLDKVEAILSGEDGATGEWTRTPPTKPGFYVWCAPDLAPEIVQVVHHKEIGLAMYWTDALESDHIHQGWWWSKPERLPEPPEGK